MTALIIDTLALANKLKKAGTGEQQAEAMADAIANGLSVAGGALATKADLSAGLSDLKAELTNRIYVVAGFIIVVQTGILAMFRFLLP